MCVLVQCFFRHTGEAGISPGGFKEEFYCCLNYLKELILISFPAKGERFRAGRWCLLTFKAESCINIF